MPAERDRSRGDVVRRFGDNGRLLIRGRERRLFRRRFVRLELGFGRRLETCGESGVARLDRDLNRSYVGRPRRGGVVVIVGILYLERRHRGRRWFGGFFFGTVDELGWVDRFVCVAFG